MAYTTRGNIRGTCGHNHRSIRTAVKCLLREQAGCRKQGGYSDRDVIRGDGADFSDDEERAYYRETRPAFLRYITRSYALARAPLD